MKKILNSKIFYILLSFQLIEKFILQKINIKCNCDRNSPILKDNNCQSIYCTKNEFDNNICKKDNEIIKTQWLNNFINFNQYRYRFTNMVISQEGDLILMTSPEDSNGQRLFFRLTKNGGGYFKNNEGEEIFTKTKQVLDDNNEGAVRYESQIFLMKLKNIDDNSSINNKEYLVSISLYKGFMEIYDLNENNIVFSKISIYDFGGYLIYSRKGSIIELNDREYFYFFIGNGYDEGSWNPSGILKKFIFYDNNIDKDNVYNKTFIEDQKSLNLRYLRIVSAFKTLLNQIVLFYLSSQSYFKTEVYNDNFDLLFSKNYDVVGTFYDNDGLFLKSIYLKQNIGIFAYYQDKENYYPKIFLENIGETGFSEMFSLQLNKYELNTDPLLNDLIKINNKRFCFISTSYERYVLYVILFDLYNNDNNIKIRYYTINIYDLYYYRIFKDLSSIIYNSYLALSLSVCNSNQCDKKDSDNFYTTLLIFSYINASDHNTNISSYFSNADNNNIDDLYLNFPNHFRIDNNIFGYQIIKTNKIIYIPEEIILYKSNNDNSKIQIDINYEYNPNNEQLLVSPKNNIIKNDTTYYIEYQSQYSEPDYDTFNEYPNEIYDYPENSNVDQREEFNRDVKIYYVSSSIITFKLGKENCKTYKLIGESEAKGICVECEDNLKFYLDNKTDTYTCISNEKDCPKESPFLLKDGNVCVKSCGKETLKDNSCILDNSSIETLSQVYTMFSDIITKEYKDEDIVLTTDDGITFQLSNSLNEKEKLLGGKGVRYNLSIIDLGECEDKLKRANGLSNDISLIIYKLETYYENTTIRNVQYEIYNPITRKQITDLSPCDDEKINIYVPTNLDNSTYTLYQNLKDQGYDIFNANDSFYNDICTRFTSVNNTDITLNDRKELYYNGSQIFCQENCKYKNIDLETTHAQCECSVSSNNNEIELETKIFSGFEIITSFYEVIKFSNFLVLKCNKLVFSSLGIKNNYGFFIMIVFISFHIVISIIFLFTGIKKIRGQMIQMIFCKFNKEANYLQKNKKINVEDFKKRIFPQNPKKKKSMKFSKSEKALNLEQKKQKKKRKNFPNKCNSIQENSSNWGLKKEKSSINVLIKKGKKISPLISIRSSKKKRTNIQKKYDEFELDDLEYLEAIKYDQRTFFEFFCCLVKREHLIIFTFIFCKDLNLLCIKLALFAFSVSLDFSINVLFFTDDSMHKIYLDYGKYNFVQQIPQIIYSTVISELFDVFFKYLSLSEKEVYKTKYITSITKVSPQVIKIIKKLKIKFLLFFLISFLLMSFFCYFISCFCAVYENTQFTLFKDSAMSFLISLIYPFGLYLIPASIRIISLRSKDKDKRFLYKISNIFPLF